MKHILYLIFGAMLLLTNSVQAQDEPLFEGTPNEKAEVLTEYMADALALTDSSQIIRVGEVNLKYAKKMAEVKESDAGRFSKLKKFKKLSEQKDEELKKILTKPQFDQFLKEKEKLRKKLKEYYKENHQ